MELPYCARCGTELKSYARFCHICGKIVEKEEELGKKIINAGLNTPDKIYLESAEVHFKRGEEALARNDLEKAILEFKYAVTAQPNHNLHSALFKQGSYLVE